MPLVINKHTQLPDTGHRIHHGGVVGSNTNTKPKVPTHDPIRAGDSIKIGTTYFRNGKKYMWVKDPATGTLKSKEMPMNTGPGTPFPQPPRDKAPQYPGRNPNQKPGGSNIEYTDGNGSGQGNKGYYNKLYPNTKPSGNSGSTSDTGGSGNTSSNPDYGGGGYGGGGNGGFSNKTPIDVNISALLDPLNPERPALHGLTMGDLYNLTYDQDEILSIFNKASEAKYKGLWDEFGQTENQYLRNILANQSEAQELMRGSLGSAVATGASQGTVAANQLSALLGMQQTGAEGALQVANERNKLASKEETELAENAKNALETSNAVKNLIANLDLTKYGYDTQNYIGELDFNAALNDVIGTLISAQIGAAGGPVNLVKPGTSTPGGTTTPEVLPPEETKPAPYKKPTNTKPVGPTTKPDKKPIKPLQPIKPPNSFNPWPKNPILPAEKWKPALQDAGKQVVDYLQGLLGGWNKHI